MDSELIKKYRMPEFPVDPIFVNRWSPRAMSGEAIDRNTLMSLFEAAKWAPSASNNQHWRFLYAQRETAHWDAFFNLLVEGNQVWAQKAAALVVIVSKKISDLNGKPARTHSYDTGAAWGSLALQGAILGLAVHGMAGFNYEAAREVLNIPEDYQVEAMAAIGRPGKKEDLPGPLQKREFPSARKKLAEIVFEGKFPA